MNKHLVWSRGVLAMLLLATGACGAGDGDSNQGLEVTFRVGDAATPADVGLPTYPGAKVFKNADESSSAANIGLSNPLFGFKVVAMKLETRDEPQKVAAFYRRALAKYGNVLECDDAAVRKATSQSGGDGDALACESGESDEHSVVYKVGTKENQRIVAIKPQGSGTQFDLVHLEIRGEAKQ